ncbi:MAG TPA: tRNA (adenosine(37)-N6)-threonylcarbamoyltransferase complex ATPase subunit type 1 TsaE [Alkalispirochaeta sp.]|nr:tRNA (adenosine(37)-N6)-threonylcarbamoyltransferase complex ATPase subunit type 1 TsaE [Alkalispirochaeta sp.]
MASSRNVSGPSRLCGVHQTEQMGRSLAPRMLPGTVVCLHGELGTGKSVLARAIARALGVTERMPSPTYTVVEEYHGHVPVLHIDLYRMSEEEEFEMLGIGEQMERSVSLVEWPERAPSLAAEADIAIYLRIDPTDTDCRICTVEHVFS